MSVATLHSIATVAAMLAFAAICWWAYRPGNRARFEADAQLPLDTDPIYKHAAHNKAVAAEEKGA